MRSPFRFARLLLTACALLALAEGCMLSNFIHKDSEIHEYSSTGKPTKVAGKKTSWLDKLNLNNLRDDRAVEVERHMNNGF